MNRAVLAKVVLGITLGATMGAGWGHEAFGNATATWRAVAGNRPFVNPRGVALDAHGNLYVADSEHDRIQRLNVTGRTPGVAPGKSLGQWGVYGAGPGQLKGPSGLATDGKGDLFVADTGNNRIQKFFFDPKRGALVLVAVWGTWGDRPGRFKSPSGVAVDLHGNVYVADTGNGRIQKLSPTGKPLAVWTKPPNAAVCGPFCAPTGVAVDSHGSIYVADAGDKDGNNGSVGRLSALGKVIALWTDQGVEPGLFDAPQGVAADGAGNLYVADTGNDRIQKLTFDSTRKVLVPLATWGTSGRHPGELRAPTGVVVDTRGTVYVANSGDDRIEVFGAGGSRLASLGVARSQPGQIDNANGVAVGGSGNVFVADTGNDRIQKFSSTGKLLAVWGKQGARPGEFLGPQGVAVDGYGDVYVADTLNSRIQKLSPAGKPLAVWTTTQGRGQGFSFPEGLAVDPKGNIYVADTDGLRIEKISSAGRLLASWGSGRPHPLFQSPEAAAVDLRGNIYVADTEGNRIQKLSPAGKLIASWGGKGSRSGAFNTPRGVAVDLKGNVYVADYNNGRVQELSASGKPLAVWGAPGLFKGPVGVAVGPGGTVYVTDVRRDVLLQLR